MSLIIGLFMETKALRFLKHQGLKLIKRNFRSKQGEIDLIMMDHETLVFIEVRYRNNDSHGDALASVTLTKQKKIIKTAELFLYQYPYYKSLNCRFDVVAFNKDNSTPNWLKRAF